VSRVRQAACRDADAAGSGMEAVRPIHRRRLEKDSPITQATEAAWITAPRASLFVDRSREVMRLGGARLNPAQPGSRLDKARVHEAIAHHGYRARSNLAWQHTGHFHRMGMVRPQRPCLHPPHAQWPVLDSRETHQVDFLPCLVGRGGPPSVEESARHAKRGRQLPRRFTLHQPYGGRFVWAGAG
jgi:hypothetical protein